MATSELIAKTAEVGGSCVAIGCAGLRFLAQYHDGLTVLWGFGGLSIAGLGFATSFYFQYQRNNRERELHKRLLTRQEELSEKSVN